MTLEERLARVRKAQTQVLRDADSRNYDGGLGGLEGWDSSYRKLRDEEMWIKTSLGISRGLKFTASCADLLFVPSSLVRNTRKFKDTTFAYVATSLAEVLRLGIYAHMLF